MTEIILIVTLLFLILILAYIKIQYPFWNMMPMYHSYNIFPYIYNEPYIVTQHHRPNTKYYQPMDIETHKFNDLEQKDMTFMKNLLHSNYIQDDKYLYEVTDNTLNDEYNSNGLSSFISMYRTHNFKYTNGVLRTTKSEYLQGLIGSITNTFRIEQGSRIIKYKLHKVNHFCCRQDESDPISIKRKLLCSHFHNVITQTKHENDDEYKVDGFLFTKDLVPHKGIIPFIMFGVMCYNIPEKMPMKMKIGYFISELSTNNISQVVDYIEGSVDMKYKVLNDVYGLPKNPSYKIYMLYYGENIIGMYIFHNKHTYCERSGGYIMDCVCSHNNLNNILEVREPEEIKKNEIIFTIGFNEVSENLKKQNISKLNIHNLGHNNQIIKHWIKAKEQYESYMYLYNIIVPNSPIQGCEYFSMS